MGDAAAAEGGDGAAASSSAAPAAAAAGNDAALEAQIPGFADMDPELQEALKMSLLESGGGDAPPAAEETPATDSGEPAGKKAEGGTAESTGRRTARSPR